VLFEYSLDGTLIVKKNFTGSNGSTPYGEFIEVNSKLYGLTSLGGASDAGVLFVYDPASDNLTVLESFGGSKGSTPEGSLMLASDHMLYGVTTGDGANGAGTLFQYDLSGPTFTVKGNFFKTIPAGADCNIIKNVILNWDDESAALILKNSVFGPAMLVRDRSLAESTTSASDFRSGARAAIQLPSFLLSNHQLESTTFSPSGLALQLGNIYPETMRPLDC